MHDFLAYLAAILRAMLAAAVGLVLPRRWWDALESLPIERLSTLSGLITCLAGLVLGARGFLAYARRSADAAVNAGLDLAARQASHRAAGELSTWDLQTLNVFSVPAFILFTPLGFFSAYLALTGAARVVSALVGQPVGDPVVTALDAAAGRVRRRRSAAKASREREALEGPEVPDRLFTGSWAGLPDVDYVVVASRRKPGWTAGTFVITSDKWYTLGEPFDTRLPHGLRTVYPLTEHKGAEVLRRGVGYELPPLSGTARRTSGPGRSARRQAPAETGRS